MKHVGVSQDQCLELARLQEVHAGLHKLAYGSSHIKPKHHFSKHLPSQYSRDKRILDTFVTERKHRSFKRIIDSTLADGKQINFEQSVLSRALSFQFEQLQDADAFDKVELLTTRLSKPTLCLELAGALNVSSTLISEGMTAVGIVFRVGDVIKVQHQCGVIVACLLADGQPELLLELYALNAKFKSYTTWRKTGALAAFSLRDGEYQLVQIWTFDETQNLVTLP